MHVFIVLFFLIHFGLIIFSYFREEQFFGWRMFSSARAYRMRFYGVNGLDRREFIAPDKYKYWLRDKGRIYFTATESERLFSRGEKYLVTETRRFSQYLCGKLEGYSSIEAELEIRRPHERKPRTVMVESFCREREA